MAATKQSKPKMGRPVVVGEDAIVTNVRLSREQDDAVRRASKQAGKRKSEWMRWVLAREAQTA
jgi:hypothetical protein